MIKVTPDPPRLENAASRKQLERALADFLPDDAADLEASFAHAMDFLRCSIATIYEVGDNLSGSQRRLALTAMHMGEMAEIVMERCIARVEGAIALGR
jgi:thioredoxin reductase